MDKSNKNSPLVAIHCFVYNHEPYLRDCFNGFVMQQTNFPFVAVVHDDASTDNSTAIIREYTTKYPHIFKPIYEDSNLYSQGGFDTVNQVMNKAIDRYGAKYIALCEGDDYWTDPYKLQKQVDELEKHANYTMCYTDYSTVDHFNNPIEWMNRETNVARSKTGDIFAELLKGNYVQTCTMLYRSEVCKDADFLARLDYEYALQNAISGDCVFINYVTANYRLQPDSAIHTLNNRLQNITIDIWQRYVIKYINQKHYQRRLFEHIHIMSIVSARMISMARSTNTTDRDVVDMLLKTNPILYIYMPLGFIIRVYNVFRKQFTKK